MEGLKALVATVSQYATVHNLTAANTAIKGLFISGNSTVAKQHVSVLETYANALTKAIEFESRDGLGREMIISQIKTGLETILKKCNSTGHGSTQAVTDLKVKVETLLEKLSPKPLEPLEPLAVSPPIRRGQFAVKIHYQEPTALDRVARFVSGKPSLGHFSKVKMRGVFLRCNDMTDLYRSISTIETGSNRKQVIEKALKTIKLSLQGEGQGPSRDYFVEYYIRFNALVTLAERDGVSCTGLKFNLASMDVGTQRAVGNTLLRGEFKSNPSVLEEIANNIQFFTDPGAQRSIAKAALNGCFGTDLSGQSIVDPKVLSANLGRLTDSFSQVLVAMAIQQGIIEPTPGHQFTSKLANEISMADKGPLDWAGKLRSAAESEPDVISEIFLDSANPEESRMLVKYLPDTLSNPVALRLCDSLNAGHYSGNEQLHTRLEVVKRLGKSWNVVIAKSLRYERFENYTEVVPVLLSNLPTSVDGIAQMDLIVGLGNWNPKLIVRDVVANISKFTSKEASKALSSKVTRDSFESRMDALQTINELESIPPQLQRALASDIREKAYSSDPLALLHIIDMFPKFTDHQAACSLITAIYDRGFGTDKNVLMKLATNLPVVDSQGAECELAGSLGPRVFGSDREVLMTLLSHLPQMKFAVSGDYLAKSVQQFSGVPSVDGEVWQLLDRQLMAQQGTPGLSTRLATLFITEDGLDVRDIAHHLPNTYSACKDLVSAQISKERASRNEQKSRTYTSGPSKRQAHYQYLVSQYGRRAADEKIRIWDQR